MRHIVELPDARATADPSGPAVADDVTALSNAQFRARVDAAASVLHRAGVRADDVVAVVLPNRVELVVVLFAAWRLGAAVTPVNPGLTEDDIRYQIEDSGAAVVVGEPGRAAVTLDVAALAATVGPVASAAPTDGLALIIYTSGTTGRPKGVLLGHDNLAAMCAMIIDALSLDETDHSLLILPLFHVNGIVVSVLSPLLAGGRTTIAGRFSASGFFDTVEAVRPTYFSAVPAIYAMLVAQPEGPRHDGSSLRLAICGAAPMPAELIGRFEQRYGVPIVEGYGLSEGTCASTLNPVPGQRKPGTVGVPLPGQTVAIMDADGVHAAPGEPGEVVVRGPNVMRGYLGKPGETAKTVVDGWLRTGDVGYFDEDGYLVLVDRIKDMIIRGGENLYPKEIENALYRHPAVHEAAVVGVPDPVWGEVPVAHVVAAPQPAVTVDELLSHCRAELAAFKVPAAIVLVPELPRNPVGKIDKKRLRAMAATV
ncbi:class I adenylate-forming enzyme family protein [Nocardia mangyaensis]|uniref:class I adenylate-forming enzyme family protein n=1 Tax=Nocardia mangyaensis TaxID=2213200 RepID=UPI0026753751|nr:AMP-binding protein [Nocardia mangyaensis]MDO3646183.1 AMP-binding protein [Nocardia mangyaensis]